MSFTGIIRVMILPFCVFILFGCANEMSDVEALMSDNVIEVEVAKNVEMIYSDSAQVRVKIMGPIIKTYLDKANPRQEFPAGVHVDFFNDRQQVHSYLDAKYALRLDKEKEVIARDSVVFYNSKNDKLETAELHWNENTGELYSPKFVRITQPEKGDTSYGYGFKSNDDFTTFEIERYSAKMTVEELNAALDDN